MAYYYLDSDAKGADGGTGDVADPFVTTGANVIQYALDNVTQGVYGDTFYISGDSEVDMAGTNLDFTTYTATSQDLPLTIIGFGSIPYDNGRITINNNGASSFCGPVPDGINIMNLDFYGGTGYQYEVDNYSSIFNCSFNNGGDSNSCLNVGTHTSIVNCHFYGMGTGGTTITIQAGDILDCFIESGNAVHGIISNGHGARISNNIMTTSNTNSGGYLCRVGSDCWEISNNSIYASGSARGYGIATLSTAEGGLCYNNYVEGLSGLTARGIYIAAGSHSPHVSHNRWFNCTTGLEFGTDVENHHYNNYETTSSGFRDAANGDFRPTDELLDQGFSIHGDIGGFPNTNYPKNDIGAVRIGYLWIPKLRTIK